MNLSIVQTDQPRICGILANSCIYNSPGIMYGFSPTFVSVIQKLHS